MACIAMRFRLVPLADKASPTICHVTFISVCLFRFGPATSLSSASLAASCVCQLVRDLESFLEGLLIRGGQQQQQRPSYCPGHKWTVAQARQPSIVEFPRVSLVSWNFESFRESHLGRNLPTCCSPCVIRARYYITSSKTLPFIMPSR